jgi:NAD-dependent deacetylase
MCCGLLRPDVVWFGELLDSELLSAAREAAQRCDLFLSVGTSAQVEPAASLPQIALNHGAVVVIVNPEVSESLRSPLYRLSGPSGVVLPALVRAAWPEVG